jgi:hypothetical protein
MGLSDREIVRKIWKPVIHLFGVSNANSVYRTGVAEDVCSRTTLPNA